MNISGVERNKKIPIFGTAFGKSGAVFYYNNLYQ